MMVFRKWPVIISDILFREITLHNFLKGKEIIKIKKILYFCFCSNRGHAVALLVKSLRYKLEGRGFDT